MKVLDIIYGQEELSFFTRVKVWLHILICPDCAASVERFEVCRDILHNDFFPTGPVFEDAVMAMINAEEEIPQMQGAGAPAEVPGGFSTRGWVIAGLIMLVSLASVFFGMEFNNVALAAGMSFMVPIGITIGIVLTSYGALFIGSHLKELTERFGL
jgi:anti-sigma factor ChrR (cupin superfamily)